MKTKRELLQAMVDSIPALIGAKVDKKSDGFYLRKNGVTVAWFKTYAAGVTFLNQTKEYGRGNYAMLRKS